MSNSYQITERHRDGTLQPMDGETYHTKAALFRALPYADYDATVVAIDFAELRDGGSTPCRDVTEDVTLECWSQLNRSEREDYAERDLFKLASRFVGDEYAAAVSAVEAVELGRAAA
jgi:hypothetical protein